MEQSLRRLSVRLETSGTAQIIDNTKIYKGSYRFVGLRAFVPVTANRATNTSPLCTVHAVTIDQFGIRRQVDNKYYIMLAVGTTQINGLDYIVFERNMPKTFTDTVGDLDLIYNYSEITTEGKLFSRMATNLIHTKVEEGGEADGEMDVELDVEAVAQINKNTLDIEALQQDYIELRQASDWLFQPIDTSRSNIVGNARVEIVNGRLAFIEMKGEEGKKGDKGENGKDGEKGVSVAAGMQFISVTPDMWRHDSASGYYWLVITPAMHGLGETPHLFANAKPHDESGGSDFTQDGDMFTISRNGLVGLTSYKPWSGLIHLMGGAVEGVDLEARAKVLTLEGTLADKADLINGVIPASQLPSYVDDVLEFNVKLDFPTVGESGKIYIDKSTNLQWRWGGSAYAQISSSIALGETAATAYRGDRGKTAYDHSQIKNGNPHNTTAADLGAYKLPASGIPESDLSITVQEKLNTGGSAEIPGNVVTSPNNSINKLIYSGNESKPVTLEITDEIDLHNDIGGRDTADCHPLSAITGLTDALNLKADKTYVDGIVGDIESLLAEV